MTMIYFGVLLVLLGVGGWFGWQYFGPGAGAFFGPGHESRIGISEVASIDGKRKLVLIYRDGVEHLVMTGGPIDVVIEQGIAPGPVAQPQRRSAAGQGPVAAQAPEPRLTGQPAVHAPAADGDAEGQTGFGRLRQRPTAGHVAEPHAGRAELPIRSAVGNGR